MKNKLFGFLILITLFSACKDSGTNVQESRQNNTVFYFNSFENQADTSDWLGLSKNTFVNDTKSGNGDFSIHLGGGCIQPAASIKFDSPGEGKYKFGFWAKMGQESQQAHLILKLNGDGNENEQIVVEVNSTDWKYYESERYLFVPANRELVLEIMVGGIVFADVYVDNLKIEKEMSNLLIGSVYKSVLNLFR